MYEIKIKYLEFKIFKLQKFGTNLREVFLGLLKSLNLKL